MNLVVMALLMLFVQDAPKRDRITSSFDKAQDFAAVSTYSWERGGEAFDRGIHQALVDAVDAEMAARKIQKVDKGGDVTVAYYAMGSYELDQDELDKARGKEIPPSKSVATVSVAMYRQPGRTRIWTAQTRQNVDVSPEKRAATARAVIGALFATMPRKPQ
jgi:hypothetical protein